MDTGLPNRNTCIVAWTFEPQSSLGAQKGGGKAGAGGGGGAVGMMGIADNSSQRERSREMS